MQQFIFILVLALTIPSVSYAACPCVAKSTGEKFSNAHVVFQGIMTDVEELPGPTRRERITFQLEELWKGVGDPQQDVIFPVSIDACGLPQEEIGSQYLVYARAQPNGDLVSTMCDGTDRVELLQADVRFLNEIYHPEGEYSLQRFSDVPATHPYAQAIHAFQEQEILTGYPDGTLRPTWPISRAELAKILSKVALPYDRNRSPETYVYTDAQLPFTDLDESAWYNLYVRRAYRSGIITGFADRTFRPHNSVTVAEAIAMIVRGMKLPLVDAPGEWYEKYVRVLADRHALPPDIRSLTDPMTRAQVVEILWRVTEGITERESLSHPEHQ